MNRIGPTHSSDYPLLMSILLSLVTLGFLGSVFPVVELVFNIAIPAILLFSVSYMLAHWAWDEYKLNQEINNFTKEVSK